MSIVIIDLFSLLLFTHLFEDTEGAFLHTFLMINGEIQHTLFNFLVYIIDGMHTVSQLSINDIL